MIRKGYSFDDVLLVPRYNDIPSRKDVDTSIKFGGLNLRVPVLSANMDTITGLQMAKTMCYLGGLGVLHRFCSIEENVQTFRQLGTGNGGGAAVNSLGVNEDLARFEALYDAGARYFCVDVAHGHTKAIGKFIKALKRVHTDIFIIGGNVASHAGADYLASCGADAIKVGIGPGSVCTTRIKTGCGVPQLTAIMDCAKVDRIIIADGGIKTPGDAVKALAAGAHVVMLGGMLAGTDETPGEIIEENTTFNQFYLDFARKAHNSAIQSPETKRFKVFRGMASKEAQEDFFGSQAEWKAAEGVQIKVRAKGPVANVMSDLMGGIRSGMTYCGAKDIAALQRNAEFIEVTANGVRENAAHGEGRL
jgi:IMP dehydrogenase